MSSYEEKQIKVDEAIQKFRDVSTVDEAVELLRDAISLHDRFQHVTTIENLHSMILNKSLWLTKGDSLSLDDWQESKKYGTPKMWDRTFIGCFSAMDGESAALWGLYGLEGSETIRISIPDHAMQNWIRSFEDHKTFEVVAAKRGSEYLVGTKIPCESVRFSDLIYASVKGNRRGEKSRNNRLEWHGSRCNPKLAPKTREKPELTGLVKDVEWAFENESRLVVTAKENVPDIAKVKKIQVPLTDELIASMSFTFNPWIDDAARNTCKKMLVAAIKHSIPQKYHKKKWDNFYPSTLTGALERWKAKRSK